MTEAFRLTLELGEETRARWQAAAVRIGYERLDVWAYDTLDASADPEAGQVVGVETMGGPERVELRARLTTADQERDAWHLRATQEITRADEAEARVEAAEQERVVQATLALTRKMSRDIAYRKIAAVEAILADDSIFCTERVDRARAALACPPTAKG